MLKGDTKPISKQPRGSRSLHLLVRETIEQASLDAAEVLRDLLVCEDPKVRLQAAKEVLGKVLPDKIESPFGFLEKYSDDQLAGIVAGAIKFSGPSPQLAEGGVDEEGEGCDGDTEAPDDEEAELLHSSPGADTVS